MLTGSLKHQEAPTLAFSPLGDVIATTPTSLRLDLEKEFEYGVLVLQGTAGIGGRHFQANELAYLGRGLDELTIVLEGDGRVLLQGGEPLNEEVCIWCIFVGHGNDEIVQAQRDWESGASGFPNVPGFDGERLTAPPIYG